MAQGHCRNILQGIESTVAQTQVSDSTASLACSPCLKRHSVLNSAVCPDTWRCCHRQRMAAAPVRSQAFSPPVVTRSPSHTTTVSIRVTLASSISMPQLSNDNPSVHMMLLPTPQGKKSSVGCAQTLVSHRSACSRCLHTQSQLRLHIAFSSSLSVPAARDRFSVPQPCSQGFYTQKCSHRNHFLAPVRHSAARVWSHYRRP